jgi:hypothetical protein
MKKFFLPFVFAALFFSCVNENEEKTVENAEITVSIGTPSVENISKTSAYLKSSITVSDNSDVVCGFCWGTEQNPTVTDSKIEKTGNGDISETVTNLAPGSVYYVRAYAIISSEPVYSGEIQFATKADEQTTVTTLPVESISDTSAVFKATVTTPNDIDVTYGFCWGTEQNPSMADSKIEKTGKGDVEETITGLVPNTLYYVRAYAIVAQDTVYGNEVQFTTEPESDANDLGDGMFLLENVTDPGRTVVEAKVSAEQWNRLVSESLFYDELLEISNTVYSKFNDDFDFIFYVLNTGEDEAIMNGLGFYGINIGVSNDVQGIGMSQYSSSSYWGSEGKLKSIMYFPFYDAIVRGPSLHELCHNWAAFVCPTFDLEGNGYSGHWGVSNAGGQLGGFKYVRTVKDNGQGKTLYQGSMTADKDDSGAFTKGGFGTFANGGNGLPYSDIELYLMGMKSAEELRNSDFHLDIYTGCSPEDPAPGYGYFNATGITSYTIDNLISHAGARIPDASASQKEFKILTVILTAPNASQNRYDEIIEGIQWFAGDMNASYRGWAGLYNFKQATYGKGSLIVDGIDSSLKPRSEMKKLSLPSGVLRKGGTTVNILIDGTDKSLLWKPIK